MILIRVLRGPTQDLGWRVADYQASLYQPPGTVDVCQLRSLAIEFTVAA